jgi:hypothetical protein
MVWVVDNWRKVREEERCQEKEAHRQQRQPPSGGSCEKRVEPRRSKVKSTHYPPGSPKPATTHKAKIDQRLHRMIKNAYSNRLSFNDRVRKLMSLNEIRRTAMMPLSDPASRLKSRGRKWGQSKFYGRLSWRSRRQERAA